ncbi:hypothetical protein [Paenibacillus durus]|uniref:Transmembrane protein n=1 Tax=Paenibacillus durus ATCC 35681 TaxID=1333534 RepID=A0A0F7FAW5_PAEDU|nr:hypothetical protein [Paenibacillus durus]AKG35729.1 hypothetical protein VK70_15075 [Paenibacillus durus ATCC 35681]
MKRKSNMEKGKTIILHRSGTADGGWVENDDPEAPVGEDLVPEENDASFYGVMARLQGHQIPTPVERDIGKAVEEAMLAVRKRDAAVQARETFWTQTAELLRVSFRYADWTTMVYSLMIYAAAYFAVSLGAATIPTYILLFALSPVPTLLGIRGFVRSRLNGLEELELSCKISLPQMRAVKLFLYSVFNFVLNAGFALMLFRAESELSLQRMFLYWCVPFLFSSAGGLAVAVYSKGVYSYYALCGAWAGAMLWIVYTPDMAERVLELGTRVYGLTAAGLFLVMIGLSAAAFGRKGRIMVESQH